MHQGVRVAVLAEGGPCAAVRVVWLRQARGQAMTVELLSVADVARITGLSAYTVREAVAGGELTASKLRNRIKIHPDDLAAWIDENRIRPSVGDLIVGSFSAPRPRATPPGGGARAAVRAARKAA